MPLLFWRRAATLEEADNSLDVEPAIARFGSSARIPGVAVCLTEGCSHHRCRASFRHSPEASVCRTRRGCSPVRLIVLG